MFRSRAPRVAARFALAAILVLISVTPVAARDVEIVVQTSSPTVVTTGLPVAYPVAATNVGRSTLNHATLSGLAPASFVYLGATPESLCSQTEPICQIGQVRSGEAFPAVTFYYLVPTTAGSYTFVARATVNEGGGDNSDDNANAADMFDSAPVTTQVVATNVDFVSGHSFPGFRTFSTGLTNLGTVNQHGSTAQVTTNAEVTVADLSPSAPVPPCPAVASSCFGWSTSLSVAQGAAFPGGIAVTIRWDASQLPKGMTDKKLKVVHILDGGGYEIPTASCTFAGGLPTNMPCFTQHPFKHSDKDLQATILVATNGVFKGWG